MTKEERMDLERLFDEICEEMFGELFKPHEADEELVALERKLKEAERENTLLREKLATIKQVEYDKNESERKIIELYKQISDLEDDILDLERSLDAQRNINEVLALRLGGNEPDVPNRKKIPWEAD